MAEHEFKSGLDFPASGVPLNEKGRTLENQRVLRDVLRRGQLLELAIELLGDPYSEGHTIMVLPQYRRRNDRPQARCARNARKVSASSSQPPPSCPL